MTIPMPEPVMRIYAEGSMRTVTEWRDGACDLPDGDHNLITTTQSKAYAAAKVREALEEAERQCRERADEYLSRKLRWQHHQGAGLGASICADAIRAMIDNQ